MINGGGSSLEPATASNRPAPHRSRPVALSVLAALLLAGTGMIVAGLLEHPAEPTWATSEVADTPVVAAQASGSPAGETPSTATAATSAAPSRKISRNASRRASRKPKSTAPSRKPAAKPAQTSPAPRPSATAEPSPSSSPTVVTLGSSCSPEGARAVSILGFPVICETRPWDEKLRWRLD
ncbi:hypothetical protein [Actinoplanes aureus]|uniref:Uncharacterized protein n=1 Tax=Actinoplanes aureus TaxID=2792083 RepID=A0A931FXE7_9ACTN|nr:hypothetical protein [Actinoplanes aureus]MBG0562410.1 hypothetical protein [Actinoplanes aureus]